MPRGQTLVVKRTEQGKGGAEEQGGRMEKTREAGSFPEITDSHFGTKHNVLRLHPTVASGKYIATTAINIKAPFAFETKTMLHEDI